MKVPESAKWAIGVAALVLLPQDATWPRFLVAASDYYAEMRLTPAGGIIVVAKNSGSQPIVVNATGNALHVGRRIADGEILQLLDGKIPPETYSVLVIQSSDMSTHKMATNEAQLNQLRIFTPAEMTHYAVTIVILVGIAVALALLVRDFRDTAGV